MDAPPRPPQPLALQGPRKIVNLPVWAGPERTTDCTILGRKPVAGIRTTALGLGDDKRISREHAILLCDTHGCRNAFHLSCLEQPLLEVPEDNWHCPECEYKQSLRAHERAQHQHAHVYRL